MILFLNARIVHIELQIIKTVCQVKFAKYTKEKNMISD